MLLVKSKFISCSMLIAVVSEDVLTKIYNENHTPTSGNSLITLDQACGYTLKYISCVLALVVELTGHKLNLQWFE